MSQRKVTKVILHPAASFACLVSSPVNEALLPCPLPYGFLISASFVVIPLKFPRTAFIFSETGSESGIFFGVRLRSFKVSPVML